MEQKVKQVLADFLNLDADAIRDSASSRNTRGWDSLTHIKICLGLEQEFDVTLEPAEMASMLSYRDILHVLRGHVGVPN